MPYTEATILECLRVGNIVPTALPHAVDEDVVIEGTVRNDDANTFQNAMICKSLDWQPIKIQEGDSVFCLRVIPISVS